MLHIKITDLWGFFLFWLVWIFYEVDILEQFLYLFSYFSNSDKLPVFLGKQHLKTLSRNNLLHEH